MTQRLNGRALAIAICLGLASVSLAVGAQETGAGTDRDHDDDQKTDRAESCRRAAQVLATGHPGHRFARAATKVAGCGDQLDVGSAIAAGLDRLRASRDTLALFALERATFAFVDGTVFNAALSIGGDPASSTAARAVGLAIVAGQVSPHDLVMAANLLAIPPPTACPLGILSDVRPIQGRTALSADAPARAMAGARAVLAEPTAPTAVLIGARCVLEVAAP